MLQNLRRIFPYCIGLHLIFMTMMNWNAMSMKHLNAITHVDMLQLISQQEVPRPDYTTKKRGAAIVSLIPNNQIDIMR